MDKLELARQSAMDEDWTREMDKKFIATSERVQKEEGWSPMDTAPKDKVIIIRYMWGYVIAEWSDERNYWVTIPEFGGGEIPGPVYGWYPAKQRGEK